MAPTIRQSDFIAALARLVNDGGRPVHYSDLARHIGVSRWTAYDMMERLEKKGLVARTYQASRGSGLGGRPAVAFDLTPEGQTLAHILRSGDTDEEWELVRESLLDRVGVASPRYYRAIADDLLKGIPERRSPTAYCAEVVTALVLRIHRLRERLTRHGVADSILHARLSARARILMITGMAAGLLPGHARSSTDGDSAPSFGEAQAQEDSGRKRRRLLPRRIRARLGELLSRLEAGLAEMSAARQEELAGFLQRLFRVLGARASS